MTTPTKNNIIKCQYNIGRSYDHETRKNREQLINQISVKYDLSLFFSFLVPLEDLGAVGQRCVLEESHGIGITDVLGHAVITGQDDPGTVTARIRGAAFRIRALHQHCITVVITTVALHKDLVLSVGIGHSLLGVGQFSTEAASALNSNTSTCKSINGETILVIFFLFGGIEIASQQCSRAR